MNYSDIIFLNAPRRHPKTVFRTAGASYHRNNYGGYMQVICCGCGLFHYKPKKTVIRNTNNYCSQSCYIKNKKYDDIDAICEICRKKYTKKFSCKKNSYCSENCRVKGRLKDPKYKDLYRLRQNISQRKVKGIPLDSPYRAKKGNGNIDKRGYRTIVKHDCYCRKNGRIFEHVWVMCNHLKRPLFKGETVHHKNGIRHDNRIENLELWNSNHGSGQRVEDKISFYKEFLEQYGYRIIDP